MTIRFDVAKAVRPILSSPPTIVSGDVAYIKEREEELVAALFDGAGHGIAAHQIAKRAIEFVANSNEQSIKNTITNLHKELLGTRGGVIVMCVVNKVTGNCTISGLGNIGARFLAPENRVLQLRGGVLGYEIVNPIVHECSLGPEAILLLHSDGVSQTFKISNSVSIKHLTAQDIAEEVMTHHSKLSDDASVIVIRRIND